MTIRKEYIKKILNNKFLLDILIEFEDILDKNHMYVFDNWKEGEIIGGPLIGKYYINFLMKYPDNMKPDLKALKRLKIYDIKYKCRRIGKYYYFNNEINRTDINNITGNINVNKEKIENSKTKIYFWLIELIVPKRLFKNEIIRNSEKNEGDIKNVLP